jgi:SulP family sulfate permease
VCNVRSQAGHHPYGIVQRYGLEGLTVATLIAGVLLIAMGLARLGTVIKFIPSPVVTGFTSGIAVVILASQVRDFLGLRMEAPPADFVAKLQSYGRHLATVNPAAVGIALLTLGIIAIWPRVSRRVPGAFVALLATTALVQVLGLEVETVGSRFGPLQDVLPVLQLPRLDAVRLSDLISPALSIALLGAIESLLSAVVADGMIGSRHRSNMELVAQGMANIASSISGGIPATGAIARTATNVKYGGRTPVAGMIHALTLLAIGLFFGRWAAQIPLATLAAILVVVAYHMGEWHTFADELRGPKSDSIVLGTTFALTVLVDLTVAIEVGMVLAAFLFMKRMSEVTNVSAITKELQRVTKEEEEGPITDSARRHIPPWSGGLRDQRRALFRSGRNLQRHARDSSAQTQGTDYPDAQRLAPGCYRAASSQGCCAPQSARKNAGAAGRTARPTVGGTETLPALRRTGRGPALPHPGGRP